jgi:uncharacterized protein
MKKIKIFNDPVYGFITVPQGILTELIDHRFFQRLRRISQLSLTNYVYPGANHTRFHHALGALHLTMLAVDTLRNKGIEITDTEAEGLYIAILLHDIGHGPFSHTLEHTILPVHHEALSLLFMENLNEEFNGKLEIAIQIFKGSHPKHFLHQLVSSQLDMDRMDYLNRDSFFTGVIEGVIGYDRILKMLSVVNNELVVEEKGIYSIEKFLIARRLMYWQVYLHKTVLAAELMLIKVIERVRYLYENGVDELQNSNLKYFFENKKEFYKENQKKILENFAMLDDFDIFGLLKLWTKSEDRILSLLSKSLLERKLYKLEYFNNPIQSDLLKKVSLNLQTKQNIPPEDLPYMMITGEQSNQIYSKEEDEIKVLFKTGEVKNVSECFDYEIFSKNVKKYYLCFQKNNY